MSRLLNDFKPPEDPYQMQEDEDRYHKRVLEDALKERELTGVDIIFEPEQLEGFIDADKGV